MSKVLANAGSARQDECATSGATMVEMAMLTGQAIPPPAKQMLKSVVCRRPECHLWHDHQCPYRPEKAYGQILMETILTLSLATNNSANAAAKATALAAKQADSAMARLSSGTRINSARDDAAGLSKASRLVSEARGLDQAWRNAFHAQAATSELAEKYAAMGNTLQRLREITVQGANGTNTSAEFSHLNREYDALLEHIEAIAAPISSGFTLKFQTGASAGNSFEFTIAKISVSDLGLQPSAASEGLSSASSYSSHISKLDTALATVVERQALIGASVNRLDYAMGRLAASTQSVKVSLGRTQDADYASETTKLAKTQILQQSATSILAQANMSKDIILSLVEG